MTVECLFVVVRSIIFYYDPKKQVEAVDEGWGGAGGRGDKFSTGVDHPSSGQNNRVSPPQKLIKLDHFLADRYNNVKK